MTVFIDGIVLALQRQGGISVYLRELLQRMQRDDVPTLFSFDGSLQQAPPAEGGSLLLLTRTARPLERYRRCRIPSGLASAVFHSSYYRRPSNRSMSSVVTVHDFTYERCLRGPRRWVHSAQKFAAIREAQAVICISQSTLDDLHELVGVRPEQQVHVILNGVSTTFRPLVLAQASAPYLLFVGQRGGYKNFQLVLQAMAFLPDFELRCVGGGELRPDELAAVRPEIRHRVRHAGFVGEETLNLLYNQAVCLVYPSRYEGFGIPVAEAMRAGCPVVSIDCKAVREIGGEALTVAAAEPHGLAASISRLTDSAYRAGRVASGLAVAARYSWESCYQATRQVYRHLAGEA